VISIVVPLFDEEENLPELYRRVAAAATHWGEAWELLCVDDGSRDRTYEVLRQLHERDRRVRAISLSRNFGHQIAVSAGLQYATGDGVVVIDGDLQDPPEEIYRFIERWRSGYQVVYGVRTKRKENWAKRCAYHVFYRVLARLTPIDIPLDSGDFCLLDRVVVDWLNRMPERNRFVRGLRSWLGFRQIGVVCERQPRAAGQVKYTFRRLVRLARDGVVNFSYRPLEMIGAFGLVVAAASFATMGFMFFAWLLDFDVRGIKVSQLPGYTSLILSVLFIGGVQLLSLGILGEYVGRIFDEVKQRPLFVVRSTIGVSVPSEGSDAASLARPADAR
jgi:dolichol-phosphate mannosyltransferase